MTQLTRRAMLATLGGLGAASVLAGGYVLRHVWESFGSGIGRADPNGGMGMMGIDRADMSRYMEMFKRHNEISRVVDEVPGGVRTTTESSSPDLVAQLQAHVSSMYSHVGQGAEVMCMSQSLPTLFRNASGYRRQLTFTAKGVIAEETSDDPGLTQAIRAHAQEVSGFVRDGMPAMMQDMMGGGGMMGSGSGGMMGPGGMMG
jgi:hypothetical protein